jgi:hypothetical protein
MELGQGSHASLWLHGADVLLSKIFGAIVGARILIFYGFNPKIIPDLGKLWFSNSKIGKTD